MESCENRKNLKWKSSLCLFVLMLAGCICVSAWAKDEEKTSALAPPLGTVGAPAPGAAGVAKSVFTPLSVLNAKDFTGRDVKAEVGIGGDRLKFVVEKVENISAFPADPNGLAGALSNRLEENANVSGLKAAVWSFRSEVEDAKVNYDDVASGQITVNGVTVSYTNVPKGLVNLVTQKLTNATNDQNFLLSAKGKTIHIDFGGKMPPAGEHQEVLFDISILGGDTAGKRFEWVKEDEDTELLIFYDKDGNKEKVLEFTTMRAPDFDFLIDQSFEIFAPTEGIPDPATFDVYMSTLATPTLLTATSLQDLLGENILTEPGGIETLPPFQEPTSPPSGGTSPPPGETPPPPGDVEPPPPDVEPPPGDEEPPPPGDEEPPPPGDEEPPPPGDEEPPPPPEINYRDFPGLGAPVHGRPGIVWGIHPTGKGHTPEGNPGIIRNPHNRDFDYNNYRLGIVIDDGTPGVSFVNPRHVLDYWGHGRRGFRSESFVDLPRHSQFDEVPTSTFSDFAERRSFFEGLGTRFIEPTDRSQAVSGRGQSFSESPGHSFNEPPGHEFNEPPGHEFNEPPGHEFNEPPGREPEHEQEHGRGADHGGGDGKDKDKDK